MTSSVPKVESASREPEIDGAKRRIVCGTDFSANAAQATESAAAIAGLLGEQLVLVHALDERGRSRLSPELCSTLHFFEREQLEYESQRLRATGISVIGGFAMGKPEEVIMEAVVANHARLIFLAWPAQPFRQKSRGKVCEKAAVKCPVPTVLVRAAAPFIEWARGDRKLRVFIGADLSAPSEAALRWVHWLRQTGPCDVVVTCLEPIIHGHDSLDVASTEVTGDAIARDCSDYRLFRRWVKNVLGEHGVRVRIQKGWGHSDAHLIQMARNERADLMVIGTQQPGGRNATPYLSVTRGVLHYAPMSVACVPASR